MYEQRNTRQTKTYDVTSASLDVWLDEFIKYDPRAWENSEGARALIESQNRVTGRTMAKNGTTTQL